MLGAMPFSALDRLSLAFARLVDGLCDPARRRRFALGFVCAYAAVWTLYGVIAKSSQDVHADMAELVVWAREPALGYPIHPPLLTYVVKLWFSIFPYSDWAYMLLAAASVSAGIYLAFELCGIWLDGEKRAAAPFLLAAIPFYNVFSLKFDHNSALIPLWALTMLAFMRSLETCRPGWSALTGLAAAAAMLTKYWSAFLLVALALTALFDRRRGVYWRSSAPWTAAIVFVLAMLPHVVWLVNEHFPPMQYVAARRGTHSVADFLDSFTEYSGGTLGYAAGALALAGLLFRPRWKDLPKIWFASDPLLRPARLLFWTPLVLPIAVAAVTKTNLLSLWSTPALSLLPVMMLASPLVQAPRIAVERLAAIVTILTLVMLAISPFVALWILKNGTENDSAYARLAAAAAEREWRETTNAPLRLVAGPFALVDSAAFYMSDRPSTYADFGDNFFSGFSPYLSPWVNETRIAHEGVAIICAAADDHCLMDMNALTAAGPPGRRSEVTLTRHWLGFSGEPKRFVIATVPPRP